MPVDIRAWWELIRGTPESDSPPPSPTPLSSSMAPRNDKTKDKGHSFITPRKRPAGQMSSSPPAPSTPTPSTLMHRHTTRPYKSPSVEDDIEESIEPSEDVGAGPTIVAPKAEVRSVMGWKVADRVAVPESAGRLRAGLRSCCIKCAHFYYNFPELQCWRPEGMASCADCLPGKRSCVMVRVPSFPLPGLC